MSEEKLPRIVRNEKKKLLEVAIDEAERAENTDRLLAALDREEALKADLAAYRADINDSLKKERKTIKDMRASLDSGKETREVACEEIWNFEPTAQRPYPHNPEVVVGPGTVTLIRLDNMEKVETRDITEEERQASLFGASQLPEMAAASPSPAEGEQAQAQEQPAEIDPDECQRLDLRALHCGLCDDDACLKCCRTCENHLLTMAPEQPDGCDRDLNHQGESQGYEGEPAWPEQCNRLDLRQNYCGECADEETAENCTRCCRGCASAVSASAPVPNGCAANPGQDEEGPPQAA